MPIPLTMMQKRDDFASYLQTLLRVHDARFVVDTLERKELEQPTDRKTRVKVTGDPERYGWVQDIGQSGSLTANHTSASDVTDYEGHRFDVRIFWGKTYASSYAQASQSAFEAMVYNESDATKPGILTTIRETRTRTVAGTPYYMGRPDGDPFDNLYRGSWDFGPLGAPELAHYLNFQITLI